MICTTGSGGPVKLDCRGNCTASLNFGLTASSGELHIGDAVDEGTGIACSDVVDYDDPDPPTNASFVPKERVLITDGSETCLWQYAYGNTDGEFFRDRDCFDEPPFAFPGISAELIAANRDRWIYRQQVDVGFVEITNSIAPEPPEGVDPEDPQTAIDWKIIWGSGLVDGRYESVGPSNIPCVVHFPTTDDSKMGIYFWGAKWVRVSDICAGTTIEIANDLENVPESAPYDDYVVLEGSTGTMSVSFNPDVADNAHLATDLSPSYVIEFTICYQEDETTDTISITVYQGEYPDSRTWQGTSSDGSASLVLVRNGAQIFKSEYAPGDGIETIFIIGAYLNSGLVDIDIGSEIMIPIGRKVEMYLDEGGNYRVFAEVTASGASSPNDPPCPE